MKNLSNGTEFVWAKEKFLNRLYLMKEMYQKYEDEEEWQRPDVSLCMYACMCVCVFPL